MGVAEDNIVKLFLDTNQPPESRVRYLNDIAVRFYTDGKPKDMEAVFKALLTKLEKGEKGLSDAEKEELGAVRLFIAQLRAAYSKRARLIRRPIEAVGSSTNSRAAVVTDTGNELYPAVIPDLDLTKAVAGDTVILDKDGVVVLDHLGPDEYGPAEEFVFLRYFSDKRLVEVETAQEQRMILRTSAALADELETGTIKAGSRLVGSSVTRFVLRAIPIETKFDDYCLPLSRVQDVDADRDIGNPHPILTTLFEHIQMLVEQPNLLATYDLRPNKTAILYGPTGSGKSFHIQALIRRMHRFLSDCAGFDVGTRTFWMSSEELLSCWVGSSDRNIARRYTQAIELAKQEVDTRRGKRRLPVIVVFEEVDSLLRRRGELDGGGGIYDRIEAVFLRQLDLLAGLPVLHISTSNRRDMIDAAGWRRIGQVSAYMGVLDHSGITAVLGKKLRDGLPYSKAEPRDKIIDNVAKWLCDDDTPVLDISFSNGIKRQYSRGDFVTGGVLEIAVANLVQRTATEALHSGRTISLSSAPLLEELSQLLKQRIGNITRHNASDYVDVPEHAQVAQISIPKSTATAVQSNN